MGWRSSAFSIIQLQTYLRRVQGLERPQPRVRSCESIPSFRFLTTSKQVWRDSGKANFYGMWRCIAMKKENESGIENHLRKTSGMKQLYKHGRSNMSLESKKNILCLHLPFRAGHGPLWPRSQSVGSRPPRPPRGRSRSRSWSRSVQAPGDDVKPKGVRFPPSGGGVTF